MRVWRASLVVVVPALVGVASCSIFSPLDYLSAGAPDDAGIDVALDAPQDAAKRGPTLLAKGQALPGVIALDDDNLYWANVGTGAIMTLRKDGTGDARQLAVSAGSRPTALTLDDAGFVYWVGTDVGTVLRVPKMGGSDAQAIATGEGAPSGVAVDGTHVYWVNRIDPDGGYLRKMSKEGGAKTTLYGDGFGDLTAVAVDGTGVYVSDFFELSVTRVAKDVDAGVPEKYGVGSVGVESAPGFAMDDTAFYFAEPTGPPPRVARLLRSRSAMPQTLADMQDAPSGVAYDGLYVYWTTYGSGTVMRARKDATGRPERLADRQSGPSSIAVDARNIYWTNAGDGTVLQLAK